MKYPFVKQRGHLDCGPASVLMILKYYDGYVNLDKLCEALCVNSKGTTFYHIVIALKSFGFIAEGYKYKDLSFFKTPCIAHVIDNNYNHYVVIWKVNLKKKYVIIGDPSIGNKKICFNEFLNKWSGNVITVLPNGKITNDGNPKILKFIFKLIRPHIKKITEIWFLSIISVICSFIMSFSLQLIIKNVNDHVIVFFICIILLNLAASYFRNKTILKFSRNLDETLWNETFSHAVKLPHSVRFRKTTGEIISFFNDLLLIKNFLSKIIISTFIDIPIIISVNMYFLFTDKSIFSCCMLVILLYIIFYNLYRKKISFLSDEVLRNKAMINSYITEHIYGIETVKNLNIEDRIIEKFKDKYKIYHSSNKKIDKIKIVTNFFNNFISYFSEILIVAHGILLVKNGQPISYFITTYFLFSLMNSSLLNLLDFDFELKDVISSIRHIQDLYEKKDFPSMHKGSHVEIKNMSYSFDKVKFVLKNINLTIENGTKILVTGKSGSGKSTLFKILKGYFKNYIGSVTIDSYEVKKYDFKNIIYISSFETLFTGRVCENLSLIKFNSLNNKICEVDDFISDYNCILDENGNNFSSGQRQRIALARALVNFDILIIDEGLMDVDENMERRILKRIFKIYKSKTIIFISHRLSNLDLFDRYIKMEQGKIVLDETCA